MVSPEYAGLVEVLRKDRAPHSKAIGEALNDVAPEMARLRTAAAKAEVDPKLDASAALLDATRLIHRARSESPWATSRSNQQQPIDIWA